jgi:hypothetical protein
VKLTASVTDDGLPKPRAAAVPRPGAQSNRPATPAPRGLSVSWLQYGGPAKAEFESAGPIAVANGQAVISVRFPRPGIYVLRATANDGALSRAAEITVSVR